MRPANGRKSDDSLNILPIFSVELKFHFFHFFNAPREIFYVSYADPSQFEFETPVTV